MPFPRASLAAIPACTPRAISRAAPAGMKVGKVGDLALAPMPAQDRRIARSTVRGWQRYQSAGRPPVPRSRRQAADVPRTERRADHAVSHHPVLPGPRRPVRRYESMQKRAELLLAPGMGHCGGGPGPNYFGQFFHEAGPSGTQPLDARNDLVTALDHWVTRDQRPRDLIATKYDHDVIGARVVRRMPLCPYPAEARYRGGDPDRSRSWRCSPQDRRLEQSGAAGSRAGVDAPLTFVAQEATATERPGMHPQEHGPR